MSFMHRLPRFAHRLMRAPPRVAYALGLGPVLGRLVLLLTTTGRRSGKPRVTPLQYERLDGVVTVAAARGRRADWVRNLLANPAVEVRVRADRFHARAEVLDDPDAVTRFLQVRLERHPRMIGAMLRAQGLPPHPTREDLATLAGRICVVALRREAP